MNNFQRVILLIGIVSALVIGLYPPWVYTYKRKSTYTEKPAGHFFVLSNPKLEMLPPHERSFNKSKVPALTGFGSIKPRHRRASSAQGYGIRLDATRLTTHWLGVILVFGGSFFVFKGNLKNPRKTFEQFRVISRLVLYRFLIPVFMILFLAVLGILIMKEYNKDKAKQAARRARENTIYVEKMTERTRLELEKLKMEENRQNR